MQSRMGMKGRTIESVGQVAGTPPFLKGADGMVEATIPGSHVTAEDAEL